MLSEGKKTSKSEFRCQRGASLETCLLFIFTSLQPLLYFLFNLTFCAARPNISSYQFISVSFFFSRTCCSMSLSHWYHTVFHWISASLRRSFRLSRKDRHSSSEDSQPAESGESKFLVYEEVTRYQQTPSDKPRLVVLIGENQDSWF